MLNLSAREMFAKLFSLLFYTLSAAIVVSMLVIVFDDIRNGTDLMQILIKLINGGIISLAVFELATVICAEYGSSAAEHGVITMLRRTLPRFIGTVCVALSLEGLIMVIKYSQLDMAGNLYYPVAIIISTAFLLAALGLFLKLTPPDEQSVKP